MAGPSDVVICGGGLAGLSLALELRHQSPERSIVVLEKERGPLPDAAHKVGESSVEGSSYWLMNRLGLKDHIKKTHVLKLGLRFFGGDGKGPFTDRFELGEQIFSRNPAYQYDRGVLENHLRETCRERDIELIEGVSITDIEIGSPHAVTYKKVKGKKLHRLEAKWLVDAMGRRKYLRARLGLQAETGHKASASWWRVQGEIDVSTLVPDDETAWQARAFVPRWNSTNHLLGHGYFVWMIPLCTESTSIGIVADEAIHPIKERSSYESSIAWLEEHEPSLARRLEGTETLDFRALKNFSYTITEPFSIDRWACVGDAAAFTDPLYSLGLDLISLSNRMTARMIALDDEGELSPGIVEAYCRIFTDTVEFVTAFYRHMYPYFDHDQMLLQKLAWDIACYWAMLSQMVVQDYVDQVERLDDLLEQVDRTRCLNERVQALFRYWVDSSSGEQRLPRGFYQFGGVDHITSFRQVMLESREHLADLTHNVDLLEELAQGIFLYVLRQMFGDGATGLTAEEILALDPDPATWDLEGRRDGDGGEVSERVVRLGDHLASYAQPVKKIAILDPEPFQETAVP